METKNAIKTFSGFCQKKCFKGQKNALYNIDGKFYCFLHQHKKYFYMNAPRFCSGNAWRCSIESDSPLKLIMLLAKEGYLCSKNKQDDYEEH